MEGANSAHHKRTLDIGLRGTYVEHGVTGLALGGGRPLAADSVLWQASDLKDVRCNILTDLLATVQQCITDAKGADVPFIKASRDAWLKGKGCALCGRGHTGTLPSSAEFTHMTSLLQGKEAKRVGVVAGLSLDHLERLAGVLYKVQAQYELLGEPLKHVEGVALPRFLGAVARGGELDKLVAGSSAPPESSAPRSPQGAAYQAPYGHQEPPRRYKDDDDDDYYKRGKNKRFVLFDIFD
jgi:Zn-finger nucleic acid-binding protein